MIEPHDEICTEADLIHRAWNHEQAERSRRKAEGSQTASIPRRRSVQLLRNMLASVGLITRGGEHRARQD